MSDLYQQALRYANLMDTQQWMLLCLTVIAVGLFCMRGFGSRSNF